MQKKTFSEALIHGRCPACREGYMFSYPISRISKFNVMNASCPHCGISLEPEPGFYQGAMYVGYAFTIIILVAFGVIMYFAGDPADWVYISTIVGVMALLAPLNYRYSRILYLHFFGGIKYNPRMSQPK